jgi:hypothetical protein
VGAERGRATETIPEPAGLPDGELVPVFPYLVFIEFLAALLVSIVLLAWALAVQAPLLPEATPGITENPAKAPWYFVGLQELLVYFDPWIAGVMIPTVIILGLMAIPYLDTSRDAVGRYSLRTRRLAIGHFLFGFALWWLLIAVGQFLRGPNWQFFWPWQPWTATTGVERDLWSLPWWLGLPALVAYFGGGVALARRRWPWLYDGLGPGRHAAVVLLALAMYAVPLKVILRLVLGVKYVLETPWLNV